MVENKIVSRIEAWKSGLTRYFTGVPCGRGHVCERMVNNHACVECSKITRKANKQRRVRRNRARRLQAKWDALPDKPPKAPVWADSRPPCPVCGRTSVHSHKNNTEIGANL